MSKAKSETLRFVSLSVNNWRNFTHADIDLENRVFLVGANASGKSNLLDVFRFLRDIVAVGGGFQEAVRKRGGISNLRCLAARREPDISICVGIGDEEAGTCWEYEVSFGRDNRKRPVIRREKVVKEGSVILNRPDRQDKDDRERLTQTYLEQVNANKSFREVAEFFSAIRYLHIVPEMIREPERSVGRRNDPFGGDFVDQIARTPAKTRSARFRRIVDALRVAVPQLKELELFRDERGVPHLRGKFEHWRLQKSWQNEGQFSDGTLRLLGLLWAVLDGSGPLLVEEPELSLHPDVAKYIPQMLARVQRKQQRQILTSTHSSQLLEDEGIGLDEVILLLPEPEGTSVRPATSFAEIIDLLEGGSILADVVIPRTRPPDVEQLMLFGD